MELVNILRYTCLISILTLSVTEGAVDNAEILSRLGLEQIQVPGSHHRKRLAVESRHHESSDDSHMYVIKLPPSQYYFSSIHPHQEKPAPNQVPSSIGFRSNGKPAHVYHWNMPVLKKVASKHHKNKYGVVTTKNFNSFANEVHDKITNINKKYKKSPSYYAPAKGKSASMHKLFSANGKPKSFYVIEKSKKAHYHRLLPY